MSDLRIPSFADWLNTVAKDGPRLAAPDLTVTERVGRAIEGGLTRLGVDEKRAVGMARTANAALGYTPVGAVTETIDAGREARKQPTVAGQVQALGKGAVMAALGAVPGGKGAGKLAMDEASRMARAAEMGFDTSRPLYHGTRTRFNQFKPSTGGATGPGVYTTLDPEEAKKYAGLTRMQLMRGDGDNSYRKLESLFARGKYYNIEDSPPQDIVEAIGGIQLPLPIDDELTNELARREFMQMSWPNGDAGADVRINKAARDAGYDGVVNGDHVVVFDPANLRRTAARFDPAKRDSKNLMAGLAGGAVGFPTFAEFLANQQGGEQ